MRTQEAFTIQLLECAERIGLRFYKTYTNAQQETEYIFYSPNRDDKIASIYINPLKNVFFDNGGMQNGGGIIAFINYLYGKPIDDTREALKILDTLYPELKHYKKPSSRTGLFDTPQIPKKTTPAGSYNKKKEVKSLRLVEVRDLYFYPLKNYFEHERGIALSIAKKYLSEIRYKNIETGKIYYAGGIKAGATWSMRSKYFKGFLGEGADISVYEMNTSTALIFEGFTDFLSYLTIEKTDTPEYTVLILNSSSFTHRAISYIESHSQINNLRYYRHRDSAGMNSFSKLSDGVKIPVFDESNSYADFTDLNDFLISRS